MAETQFDVFYDNIEDSFYIVGLHDLEEEDGHCIVDLEEDGSCVDLHNVEEDEYGYCVVDLEDVDVEDDGNRVIWGEQFDVWKPRPYELRKWKAIREVDHTQAWKANGEVDYPRLTSFLEVEDSFLSPWRWKPDDDDYEDDDDHEEVRGQERMNFQPGSFFSHRSRMSKMT
jgi:hypothetical protein